MANYTSAYTGSQHDQYVTASQIINLVYPVGSIYISANNVNPSTFFGGTWEQIQGKFLLGVDNKHAIGSTGGKESYVADDMPTHTHTRGTMEITGNFHIDPDIGWCRASAAADGANAFSFSGSATRATGGGSGASGVTNDAYFVASRTWTGETSQSGTITTATIVPPYLTVSIWKRIS